MSEQLPEGKNVGLEPVVGPARWNVEFKIDGEWQAQHTMLSDQGDAVKKARDLYCHLVEKHREDRRFDGVRITEGLPFGTVIARCNRVGAVKWL